MERWLPVPGFEGLYKVSDQGCVRRLKPTAAIRGHAVRPYLVHRTLVVSLQRDGERKYWQLHHLVMAVFGDTQPPGTKIAFRNGDPTDCRIENLYYRVTSKTLVRTPRQRATSKLSTEDVKAIHESEARNIELAIEYDVDTSMICRIRNGERR